MPKTWTETRIRISDQLQETIPMTEYGIVCKLALDSLNNPDAWLPAGDGRRCCFLANDGSTVNVEIGVATVESNLAAVFSVHVKDASLADLCIPLTRIDEFEADDVDADYESRPISERPALKVRLGEIRRLQPMKHDPED